MTTQPQVILASKSPRRQELLSEMGVVFEVIPSTYDEVLDDSRDPQAVAVELAFGKASEVAERFPDAIVVGSDTIVAVSGRQLGKPADSNEARAMLQALAGKSHEVVTSVVVICQARGIRLQDCATTRVYFKPYDSQAVEAYLASGDAMDKAGAYGIQSGAAPLIDHIEGRIETVIGLPTHVLADLLKKVGVSSTETHRLSPVPVI